MLKGTDYKPAGGFSLVEILVVLLIFAIMVAIAIPSLISSQPERNLAAAGDVFANDVSYARAKAESTGNTVYLGFITNTDAKQIEANKDVDANDVGPTSVNPYVGGTYRNPANPGIARTAKEYYIVEARPRFKEVKDDSGQVIGTEPYTYTDWLDDYDAYDNSAAPYPVEPLFPEDAGETARLLGGYPDRTLGEFNAFAAPIAMYPQQMRNTNGGLIDRFRDAAQGTDGWASDDATSRASNAQMKLFCVADEEQILNYDQTPSSPRVYDPLSDHPQMQDQVVDYVLLKRVALPEHVWFINPWRSQWMVSWEDIADGGGTYRDYDVRDMQFLQYLYEFKSDGTVAQASWGYDPEPFPATSPVAAYDGLVYGSVVEKNSQPGVYMMWMGLEECLDFAANTNYMQIGGEDFGARADVISNKKSNTTGAGRMFSLWSLNGKYYVDEYAPNDFSKRLVNTDYLNLNYTNGGSEETDQMPLVAREMGYNQNFLMPHN
jgi:prepilin-type N-terminal cleavage/methylation domain-containing protein